MVANQDNAIWESNIYTQGEAESNWKEYQFNIKSKLHDFTEYYEITSDAIRFRQEVNTFDLVPKIASTNGFDEVPNNLVVTSPDIFNGTVTFNGSYSVAGQEIYPSGVAFSTDGTKMYVVGSDGDDVNQYTLTTAFDMLGTVTFNGSYSVGGQEVYPSGVTFSNDGTRMYVVGTSGDDVNQYTLDTAFDVLGTVTFNGSYSVGGQEVYPSGVTFSDDGTKMYVVGYDGDDVNQYTLTTAFDVLGTVTFNGSYSVSVQDTSPMGVTFSNDGTKMYIVGTGGDSVYQYTLDTAFDILGTVKFSGNYSVGGQDTAPYDVAFSADGTKMYVVGNNGQDINQYSLPNYTARGDLVDYSTDVTFNGGYYVGGQETSPYDVAFSNDGTKMYVVGTGGDSVYQYTLTTAFDVLNTVTFNGSYSVSVQDTSPMGVTFNNDGTKMYVLGYGGDNVHQYTLDTAFDVLGTVNYDGSYSVGGQEANPYGLAFSNDGTKMYVVGSSGDAVNQYTLTTAFDILGTVTFNGSYSVAGQETSPSGVAFSNDGTKMYILGNSGDDVNQYTLTTAFDVLNTVTFDGSYSVSGQETSPMGVTFNNDGTKMYVVGTSGDDVNQYTISNSLFYDTYTYDISPLALTETPSIVYEPTVFMDMLATQSLSMMNSIGGYINNLDSTDPRYAVLGLDNNVEDLFDQYDVVEAVEYRHVDIMASSIGFDGSYDISGQEIYPQDVTFNNDGTKMYVIGTDGDDINQYTLTTAFDVLNTVTFDGSYSVSGQETSSSGLAFSTDGTKMYAVGYSGDDINQYTLTTAFDVLDTVTFNGSYSVAIQEIYPYGLAFSNDGTKMYVLGTEGDDINQYTLTTAFDILGTVTFNGSYSVAGQETNPSGVAFSNDGTKMYVVGHDGDSVYQYTLTTPFDVLGTVNYDGSYSVGGQEIYPSGVAFSTDGTKMYVVGSDVDNVNQYTLTGGQANTYTDLQIQNISVADSQTTLDFGVDNTTVPDAIKVQIGYNEPALVQEVLTDETTHWSLNKITDKVIFPQSKRHIKFRIKGDTDDEVLNAQVNLWKL